MYSTAFLNLYLPLFYYDFTLLSKCILYLHQSCILCISTVFACNAIEIQLNTGDSHALEVNVPCDYLYKLHSVNSIKVSQNVLEGMYSALNMSPENLLQYISTFLIY